MTEKPHKFTKRELLFLEEMAKTRTFLYSTSGMDPTQYITRYDEDWNLIEVPDNSHPGMTTMDKVKGWSPSGTFWRAGVMVDVTKKLMGLTKREREFPWYAKVYEITQKGRDLVSMNREKLAQWHAEEAEKRAKAERLVIIGYRWSMASERGKRQYAVLAKVVRETENRLYVREEVKANHFSTDKNFWGYSHIQGQGTGTYVDRQHVLVDNATVAMFKKLVALDDERSQFIDQVRQQEEDEITPIRERYKARREQQQAMFEDMTREILEKKS